MILVEAQSTWTVNILVRVLLYLAQSYHEYFERTCQNLYKSRRVTMPKPEVYVIYTGEKGEKPDELFLSKEFFDEVTETIRICKSRNVLKEYLEGREKEVVTIMMSLFDEEQIVKSYIRSERYEAAQEEARETAERMIKKGKMTIEEIAEYVPALSLDELKKMEAELAQVA